MSKKLSITPAYRWAVASRVVAAALGGYALTSAATLLLSVLWPAPQAQGVLWATMLSFTIYTVVVLWVCCTATAKRAWAGVLIGTAVLCALAWLSHGVPGGGA